MTAAAKSIAPVRTWLADAASAWWQADRGRLVHASKTVAAVLLATWLSMRLELASPRTAMVSVVILMMHQHSGMVLARGFYRALGMLVGSFAALLLFFVFPQERVLFLLGLSMWIGLCVCGATYYRNYQSYGFVLSGYATCIAAVPSIANPYAIFENVVVSLSEVSVGIACAGLVSGLVFPQRVAAMLLAAGQQHIATFTGFIRDALQGRQTAAGLGALHLRLAGERAQLESLRSAVVFEDPEMRANNALMIRLNHDFLDALARFHTIHQLRARMAKAVDHRAGDALDALFGRLAAVLPPTAGRTRLELAEIGTLHDNLLGLNAALPSHIAAASATLSDAPPLSTDRFAAGASALRDAVADLLSYTGNFLALRSPGVASAPRPRAQARRRANPANRAFALASGVRATAAVLASAWLWIVSGWAGGSSGVIAATIAIALYSIMPQPTAIARQMLIGCALAWLAGLFFNFFLLPHLDGFLLLAVALAPFIALGSYVGTFPPRAAIGLGFGIYFCFLGNLSNPMVFNPAGYLDSGIATLLGIAIASLAFATIVPQGGHWLAEQYLKQLRTMVATDICRAPLGGLRLHFETHIRDFIQFAGSRPAAGRAGQAELLGWAFAALEIGLGMIALREATAQGSRPAAWESRQENLLAAISALFLAPSPRGFERALQAMEDAIGWTVDHASRPAAEARAILHTMRLSLLDDALPLVVASSTNETGTPDAP
ncbi:fusaric acid resistance protein FusC (plasmid) [Cupriavidus necator N-1]|uniref:Fusaric acid resistance protein FusC n=1 Tax=Cupriavidus necator (strain ATCC 43291 / DSM 13513 / CCUG 52238 / LMG 8453 / N-1) TaxID=1042878 RepID=F8GYA9_CUPNN|nr:FUSC family protein [Cupriavidus necator]AEI82850.1 fusaric acid resistance protein FusC [Cupriavidus necator N-1]MDX6008648.1 FUSC family protein [Cupriavidus necator]